jgi:hypothetical protein
MSGGGSDTTTTTNSPPAWLTGAGQWAAGEGQNVYNNANQQGYNPLQQGAADASGLYGSMAPGALTQGYNTYSQNANFQPDHSFYGPLMQMLGGGGGGGSFGMAGGGAAISPRAQSNLVNLDPSQAAQAQAGTMDLSQLQQMQAGQLNGADLSGYMNPFQQSVIDTTMQGLNQNLALQQQNNAGQAASAGAFGGTRQAVQAALTNQAGQQTAASTLAGLNSQNFGQAQQAALQDIQNSMQASQFNAGQYNAGLNFNAGNEQQTNLANANAQNQYGLANAANATSRYGADQSLAGTRAQAAAQSMAAQMAARASMHNSNLDAALGLATLGQNGSIQGAGIQNNSAAGLLGMGQQGIGDMSTWGNQIYNQPMQNLGWYTGMLGSLAGSAGSTGTTTTPGSNPWAGILGTGAQALAAYYGSGGGG